ncbi:MAG TPA: metallophosphoesterase [Pyrodictium sp.]|nr:metallophosphoesterase [Pyrodictium sp.]
MLVGVISDTHDDLRAVDRAAKVFKEKGVDIVLHLGDIVAPFTLARFKKNSIEKLIAVFGNNCGERLGLKRVADEHGYTITEPPHVLEIAGRRILMLHGWGPTEHTRRLVESFAKSGNYNIVLYGHTHLVDVRRINGTLIVNPGEACGCLTGKKTIAILNTKTLDVEIIEL